ncbi:hypothetical protein VNI00_005733 [Paramarasmius palmivorus]|uniref:NAD(P)-binding domain-containing protein n=1 Tax=Paramarasmius palmivorus TaxID=297713 RepID=A0AAW0DDI6_9AGAR
MNIFAIGAARNIGYYSSVRLLDAGCTVTFLLRNSAVFDEDEVIKKYIASGKVHLVKGDALVQSDVQRGWEEAAKHGPVDLLLFTVGGAPNFSFRKGFYIDPYNLVAQSMLNALCTMPKQSPSPKVIAVTPIGLTRSAKKALPLPVRLFCSYLLHVPFKDKIGVERVLHHCGGMPWEEDEAASIDVLGPDWKEKNGLPEPGSLKDVLIVRGALFTDGDCTAETKGKPGYRVATGDLSGAWTISRKDVAYFIVDTLLNNWDQYRGHCVSIAY